jgi:hypothetical protein
LAIKKLNYVIACQLKVHADASPLPYDKACRCGYPEMNVNPRGCLCFIVSLMNCFCGAALPYHFINGCDHFVAPAVQRGCDFRRHRVQAVCDCTRQAFVNDESCVPGRVGETWQQAQTVYQLLATAAR